MIVRYFRLRRDFDYTFIGGSWGSRRGKTKGRYVEGRNVHRRWRHQQWHCTSGM